MRATLQTLIGTYTPSGDGIAGVDYEYIVCAVIFILFLWFSLSYLKTIIAALMSKRW